MCWMVGMEGDKEDVEGEMTEIPRLNRCFLCKRWRLEAWLYPIEVPDQTGYVKKLACKRCLDAIIGPRDEAGQAKII